MGETAANDFFLATQGALVAAGGLTYRIPAVKNMSDAVQLLTPLYHNDPVSERNLDTAITSEISDLDDDKEAALSGLIAKISDLTTEIKDASDDARVTRAALAAAVAKAESAQV